MFEEPEKMNREELIQALKDEREVSSIYIREIKRLKAILTSIGVAYESYKMLENE